MTAITVIRRAVLLAALCVTLVSASAAAQDVRLLDRFPAPTASRLIGLVDSAAAEGLPTRPMILRALEGQAKGVPTDRIIEVVGRLRIDLQQARTTLGTTTSADELTSAAAALRAGVSTDKLAELRQLRGRLPLTVPLDAWLGLINRGAVPDRAWDHIAGLAKRQARDAEFSRLTLADLNRGIPGRP